PIPEPDSTCDNFLASRPAELFLQDVYGLKIKSKAKPDPINGVEPLSECLVRQDSATFLATGVGSLLDGLRRNQSLPAMIGATRGSPSHHLAFPVLLLIQ
uniref:Uncharacterized protein n=1 Tax=Oncorhynchus kisutch TaxID=8019 RepID=A0A8C7HTL1_ONCKI